MKPLVIHRKAEDVIAEARKHPAIADLPANVVRLLVTLGTVVSVYAQARVKGADLFDVEFIALQLHDLAHKELEEAGVTDYDQHHVIMQAADEVIAAFINSATSNGGDGTAVPGSES